MRKGNKKRVLAFLLAMFMVFSTMGNASLTVAASGNAPVDVTTEITRESDVAQTENGLEGTTGSEEKEAKVVSTVGSEEQSEEDSVINEETTTGDEAVTEAQSEEESAVSETEEQPEETSVVTTETETEAIEETVTEVVTTVEMTEETTVVEETDVVIESELFEEVGEGEAAEPYYGEVYGGEERPHLEILGRKMSTFSDEALLEIINYRKEQELRFDSISVSYPYVEGGFQGSVSKDVWNGLCELLADEYGNLLFMFIEEPDDDGSWYNICRDWVCFAPTQTEEDVIFNVEWKSGEPGAGVELTFANTTFPAQNVEMQLYFERESSACETVRAAFAEGTQAILYQDGKIVMDCSYGLNKDPGSRVDFRIKDINDLTKDTVYVLNAKGYTGTVGNDPNGGRYKLDIYREKEDGTLYTDDELIEMLQWNLDTYGRVFTSIDYHDVMAPETSSRVLSGKVANATRNIMTTETTGMFGHNIGYYTSGDSESGDSVSNIFDVYMHKPEENFAPEEDATVSYNLTVSGQEAKFSFDAPDYKVKQLQMRVFYEKGTQKANALEMLFGENVRGKHFWIADKGVMYDSDNNGVMLTFLDVKDLERNKVYAIKESQEETVEGAPGTIINNYGTRELKVSAHEIGADNWAKGSIKTNLAAYKKAIDSGKIQAFDQITIIQKEQDNNVIYKEDYNFLLGLLRKYNYPKIYFDFNGAWNGGLTKEIIWEFDQPTKASADITANVSYEAAQVSGGAIKMKIAQTTYPAKFADVRVYTNRNSDLGKLFDQALGEVTSSLNNKRVAVATTLGNVKDVYAQYSMYVMDDDPELAENVSLTVGSLQKYGKKEFYLLPVNDYKETFALGKSGGYQLETSMSPDGEVTWQGLNSYYATLTANGILTPIRETGMEGDDYHFWACYQSGGQPVTELYHAKIERRVVDMRFSKASMEHPIVMELPPLSDENAEDVTIDINWIAYPTGTGISAEELQWSVEGEAVELVTVSGNCIGEIKAVSSGEAVVTATYTEAPGISASAKVIVKPSIWDEINSVNVDIMAVSGIHKTLKDLNNQLPKGFAWANPDMSLAGFTYRVEVPVVYTAEDGRTAECDVEVYILTFEDIDIGINNSNLEGIENGAAIQGGETIYFNNLVKIKDFAPMPIDSFNTDGYYGSKYQLSVVPAAKTKNLVKESDHAGYGQYMFESSTSSPGKKTCSFELHLSDVSGNILGVVSKGSASVTITKNPVMNWNNVVISRQVSGQTLDLEVTAALDEKGQLVVLQPAESYFKLTAKSLDNTVCKITQTTIDGESYIGQTATRIDYEIKKGGRVYIELTAADETKSKKTVRFNAEDIMPKVEQSAVTIDKARKDITASVKWQLHTDTSVGVAETVLPYTINGKESADFTVVVGKTENLKAEVKVTLNNKAIKNGKYKLKLQVPVIYSEAVYANPFETEIVVTVKDTKPTASIKQSKKVNLLYKNNAECGMFEITPKGEWTIADVRLEDQSSKKKCDYELQVSGNVIRVGLKDGGDPKNTKGKLVITTNEYAEKTVVKNVTIATENKKPAIVLSKKTESLYPNFYWDGNAYSTIELINKTTGEVLSDYELQVKEGRNWVSLNAEEGHSYASNKNQYTINHRDGRLVLTLNTEKKATDKFKFRVKQADWTDNNYVELSYTIKVDTSVPKLVPGSSTLVLNKNEAIYGSQLAQTKLTLKGGDNHFDETYSVSFEGVDVKAENVRNKYLDFSFSDGKICVSFHDSDKNLATGKYKYSVRMWSENTRTVYTNITVNIVDAAPQKCLKVKGKGTIDILNREDTAVTYTVKASNLQGRLVACHLIGPDANKFDVDGVNGGKIVVKASKNATLSTKVAYKVVPVMTFENEEGWRYNIKADTQKIKVKQGKPKVTVTAADGVQNILYRDRDNKIVLDFNAVLGKKPVKISGVELANYTSDLTGFGNWNPETGELESVTLSQYAEKQILASGKTWKVKFNVYFTDGAGNEKVTQVTYKLMVK